MSKLLTAADPKQILEQFLFIRFEIVNLQTHRILDPNTVFLDNITVWFFFKTVRSCELNKRNEQS